MKHRRNFGKKSLIIVGLLISITILVTAAITAFSGGVPRSEDNSRNKIKELQGSVTVPLQSGKAENLIQTPVESPAASSENQVKNITISQNGNIDILVNFIPPAGDKYDELKFEVTLETHTSSLSDFSEINQFAELITDTGITVNNNFKWESDSTDSHHISGTLTIANDFEGRPFIDETTKSFTLIFKGIPKGSLREHKYPIE